MSQAVISVAFVLSVGHFLFCGLCQSLYSASTCPIEFQSVIMFVLSIKLSNLY